VLNDVLRDRNGAVVAPWSAVAGRDGVVYDQVHPSEEGRQVFAEVVGEAVESITG
jgi:hypothetical protein